MPVTTGQTVTNERAEDRWGRGPSVTDGGLVDPVAGVEVEAVVGGDVVVGTRHDALLHVDVESIVLEHSTRRKLSRKFMRIWIKYLLEVKREH